MTKTNAIGKVGEQQAIRFLKKNGHKILFTNWRHKHLEVDIISKINHQIVFTEVKTKSNIDFGKPDSFVSKQKKRNLIKAANEYCFKHNYYGELRFDIIAVYNNSNNEFISLEYFEDAFYDYSS